MFVCSTRNHWRWAKVILFSAFWPSKTWLVSMKSRIAVLKPCFKNVFCMAISRENNTKWFDKQTKKNDDMNFCSSMHLLVLLRRIHNEHGDNALSIMLLWQTLTIHVHAHVDVETKQNKTTLASFDFPLHIIYWHFANSLQRYVHRYQYWTRTLL